MTQAPETPEKIRADCLDLVNRLYRHRYNTKLLLMARNALQLYADYKSNRDLSHNRLKVRKEGYFLEETRDRDPQSMPQDRRITPSQLPTDAQVQAYLRWISYPVDRYEAQSAANQRNTQILAALWLKNVQPSYKKEPNST